MGVNAKRKLVTRTSVGLLVGMGFLATWVRALGADRPPEHPLPALIVERGERSPVPWNSAASIEFEREEGHPWFTVDVCSTRDGVFVLFRDPDHLESHSNLVGPVSARTWSELEGLDIGAAFAARYAGQKLLSLEAFWGLLGPNESVVLRCRAVHDGAELARRIRAAGREGSVLVAGPIELARAVRLASDGKIAGMTPWPTDETAQSMLEAERPDAVEVDFRVVSRELCRRLHGNNIRVAVRMMGESEGLTPWRRAAADGADWLITDVPEEVVADATWNRLAEERKRNRAKLCLHRGASRYTPENTLAAVDKSIRLGADFVELDVRTAKDGRFFLMHDAKVDRTTNGTGPIARMPGEEVARLDAGSWFGKPFAGLAVPRFEAGIEWAGNRLAIYVDAKLIAAPALARLLVEYRIVETAVVYQGPAYLAELKRLEPRARTLAPLPTTAALEAIGRSLTPYAVDASWRILSRALIEKCHARGIRVFSDAPDEAPAVEYRRVMEWGIDLIQTDRPLEYFRALAPPAAGTP